MAKNLTYLDFAVDQYLYLQEAYNFGIRRNDMVSQAQRTAECYLKHLITTQMLNATDAMRSHNLRELYDYITKCGINITSIREPIMHLNNYYTHTRYPGRDAFLASKEDIESAYNDITIIAKTVPRLC